MKLVAITSALLMALASAQNSSDTATSPPLPATHALEIPPNPFNFSQYCNGSAYDSMHSSPSGTKCFNAKQEWVGITDWFLTGYTVLQQFRNMDAEPNVCKVLFNSDPFPMWGPSQEFAVYTVKSKSRSGAWTEWEVVVNDARYSAQWVDAGIKLENTVAAEFVKFTFVGENCMKNVMIACNNGASAGLGTVAISLGKGYWEHKFGTSNIAWENCGPGGQGVKPKQRFDYGFHISPWAMSGDWDRFWSSSYLTIQEAGDTRVSVDNYHRCSVSGHPDIAWGPWDTCKNIN